MGIVTITDGEYMNTSEGNVFNLIACTSIDITGS